jgi:hypothetical protein
MNERPPPDISLAVDAGVRWMSYADIAVARGVSVESATRMVRRKRWRRQPGNGATILVAVPLAELTRTERRTKIALPGQPALPSPGSPPGQKGLPSPDIEGVVRGFEAALSVLSEQLAAERKRADNERARATTAEADRDRVEMERDRLLASHDRLAVEVEALKRADATRRAAGRLTRLKTAWRGE